MIHHTSKAKRQHRAKSIKLTGGEMFLVGMGSVCILAGIITGIWPVALAGIGPLLLVFFDVSERKSGRRKPSKA